MVGRRVDLPRHHHQLPFAQRARRARAHAEGPDGHQHAAVFLHRRRVPDRLHDHATGLRVDRRSHRPQTRLRPVCGVVVDRRLPARGRHRLGFAGGRARPDGTDGSGGDSRRHEGGRRMVPGQGEVDRGRLLQRRHLARRPDRAAARRRGHADARVARGLRRHRRSRLFLGGALVRLLPPAERACIAFARRARADPVGADPP
jgi:hypothetical protein